MQETPENPAPEAAASAVVSPPAGPSFARTLLLGALLGGALVFAGLSLLAPVFTQQAATSLPPKPRAPKPAAAKPEAKVEAKPAVVAPAPVAAVSATVSGSVADEFGRAIAGATVFVGHDLPKPVAPGPGLPVGELGVTNGPVPVIPTVSETTPPKDAVMGRTDQDGKFVIAGVAPGSAQVFVTQAGYEPNLVSLDNVQPGETRDGLYIVLLTPLERSLVDPILPADPELARIVGIVLDRLGRPVVGATVRTDEGEATARTDGEGAFVLINVAPGALHILADDEHAGRAQSQEVRARVGETLEDVRIHLPGRGEAPSSGAAVTVEPVAQVAAPARTPSATKAPPTVQGGVGLEDRATGVFVNLVDQASPAGQAGLGAGDTLLRVDDETVLSAAQARGMLRDPAGELVRVQVKRGSKRVTLKWKRPSSRFSDDLRR